LIHETLVYGEQTLLELVQAYTLGVCPSYACVVSEPSFEPTLLELRLKSPKPDS
jgi:hypothetical protein